METICKTYRKLACGKPAVFGFDCCEECIKYGISLCIVDQNDLITSHPDINHSKLSPTAPESDKCQYRMRNGEYKGWYCSSKCPTSFSFCISCIKKIMARWIYKDDSDFNENTNNCLRLKPTLCSKPVLEGYSKCNRCIKTLVSKKISLQRNLKIERCRYSQTIPEKGKCLARVTYGKYEGWYCSAPCLLDFDFCNECLDTIEGLKITPKCIIPPIPKCVAHPISNRDEVLSVTVWGEIYKEVEHGFLVKEVSQGVFAAFGKEIPPGNGKLNFQIRNLTEEEKAIAIGIGLAID